MEEVRAPTAEAALRRILTTAVRERVSDVHIEPQESFIRVRFRRDGILYDRFTMMLAMKKPISVRQGRREHGHRREPAAAGRVVFGNRGRRFL